MAQATEKDFNEVTDGLGPVQLQYLFHNLEIKQHFIERAEVSASTTDPILRARAVLREWRKRQGSNATLEALLEAKKKALQKRGKGTSEEDVADFKLKESQDELRQFYMTQMRVRLTPWDPEHTEEMDAIFVDLELVKDEVSSSQVKQIPLKRNEDLVTLQTSKGLRVNRILVQGEAGSGKSTLLDNIAYKWALQLENTDSVASSTGSSESPLSEFDLLFIINIHEIGDKNDSLEDIIFNQLLEAGTNVSKKSLKAYLKANARKCLFLIDGLDNDNVGILKSTTGDMSLLLYNKMYRESCVISSTRSHTLKDMGENLRHFTKVKLTGFSGESILLYILKFFPEDATKCTNLFKQLTTRRHLFFLARVPLLLLFFCLLRNDDTPTENSLPDTRTKLYHETIEGLYKRYHYREGLLEDDEINQQEFIEFLDNLGQVSLIKLLDHSQEKVSFNQSDFKEKNETLLLALRVGILSKERFRSNLHMKTSITFLHTSIQDFCSAVYLSNLHCQNTDKFKENVSNLLQVANTHWSTRTAEALVFCAGCKPETVTLITHQFVAHKNILHSANVERLQHGPIHLQTQDLSEFMSTQDLPESILTERIQKYDSMRHWNELIQGEYIITFMFLLAFEAQLTYEKCNTVASILSSARFPLALMWNVNHTENSVQYQLELLQKVPDSTSGLLISTLSSINISRGLIEFPKYYPSIVSMLKYAKKLCTFRLVFKFVHKSNQVFPLTEMFTEFAHLEKLKGLHIQQSGHDLYELGSNVDITDSLRKIRNLSLEHLELRDLEFTATSMADFLCSNKSLKYLSIVHRSILLENIPIMISAISNIPTLSSLRICQVVIGREVTCLKHIIPHLSCLQLVDCCLNVRGVRELASYLQKAQMLQKLVLSGDAIGTAINSLADQLKHMVKLKELALNECNFGNLEAKILADGIKQTSSLCSLDLTRNPNIGSEGRQAIESLHTHPQFQELDILLDPVSNSTMKQPGSMEQAFKEELENFMHLLSLNPVLSAL